MSKKDKKEKEQNLSEAVDYARRVLDFNFAWYKNADTKAEIILTLDGVFIAFVTGSIFMKQTELIAIMERFYFVTWVFLVLMVAFLLGSIVFSILCLWSRIPIFSKQKNYSTKDSENGSKNDNNNEEPCPSEATLFFANISCLEKKTYQDFMLKADREDEISALAFDIHTLSVNVNKKHKWVDLGFILTGMSLFSFLAFGISYIIAVADI